MIPSEWPDLFGDPLLASAGLDRLAHKAHVLVIGLGKQLSVSANLSPSTSTETQQRMLHRLLRQQKSQ
jgi:hypothetical protein